MATKEAKPKAKKAEHKKAPEAIPPHKQANLPTLPYKTCSLRVSIHCEGCKRKVKKILTNIEGVYEVDVDLKQQKVTVVGIISSAILIKKLIKAGKNAEILMENPDPKVNKPGSDSDPDPNPKNKDKKKDDANITKRNDDGATTSGGQNNAGEKLTAKKGGKCDEKCSSGGDPNNAGCSAREKSVNTMNGPGGAGEKGVSGGGDGAKDRKNSGCGKTGEAGGKLKEKKAETKKVATGAESPAAEDKKVEASCSGSIAKKKKKKGQKGNNNANAVDGQRTTDAPGNTGSSPSVLPPVPQPRANLDHPSHQHLEIANHIPPRHQEHPYPPNVYIPPPIYGVSYNVAQPPASVYGASYDAAPYSHTHMHSGFPPSDQNPYASSRPSDSFEYFSDENPNACSVM